MIRKRPGLSRIEVIVIIVLATAAIGLVTPFVIKAREHSARMETMNNLKECALAVHSFHDQRKALPNAFGPSFDHDGKNVSLWFQLLPYVKHKDTYTNGVVDARVAAFLAPQDISNRGEPGTLSFAGNIRVFGFQSINGKKRNVANMVGVAIDNIPMSPEPLLSGQRLQTLPDGTTNIIMMTTRYSNCARQKTWYAGDVFGGCELTKLPSPGFGGFMGAGAYDTAPTPTGPVTAIYQLAPTLDQCLPDAAVFGHSFRTTGMSIALCDGSVRNIRPDISIRTFQFAICPGDGNPINDDGHPEGE